MKKGICIAGNMIVDVTYPIEGWPRESELARITGSATRSVGGAVCNVVTDLARLDETLPLYALGVIGEDQEGDFILEQLRPYRQVDLSLVKRQGVTAFTSVMSSDATKTRTFFHFQGANASFDESCMDWERVEADILHVGYILVLDALDQEDEEYGTKMARLLHHAQSRGIRTSIDVASETGDRFQRLVPPALKYTDYCVINELEAQQVTGILLRDSKGQLYPEHMQAALEQMGKLGVSTWAVIHCPEGGFGMDSRGNYICQDSLQLPEGYIRGTVGAGDAFCSGVLYGAYQGWSLAESLRLAACAAGASLSEAGASEGMRPLAEVLELWEKFGR